MPLYGAKFHIYMDVFTDVHNVTTSPVPSQTYSDLNTVKAFVQLVF